MNVCRGPNATSCYCQPCQARRLALHSFKFPDTLLREITEAEKRENEAIELTFNEVLNQVAICKAFRTQLYNIYRYKNTASYFKQIKGYSKENAKIIAGKINGGSKIYDRFNAILVNLKPCSFVDIRKLSLNQLMLAFDPKWCLMHNEVLRNKIGRTDSNEFEPDYSEDEFQDFLRVIKSHRVYLSIDKSGNNNYGRKEVTALMHRAQKTLL